MVIQNEDRARAKKAQADLAIQMALQGRWEEAVDLNRTLIDAFPTDVDAYNRLGKAMTELGRYADARNAYEKALDVDPVNSIARKNLQRLATLGEKRAPPKTANQKISPQMFIEEMGKTGVTVLLRPNMKNASRLTAGDLVSLDRDAGVLVVKSLNQDQIGEVEPKLGQRLLRLMDGGNEYIAAIHALSDTEVRVFIRETFQDAAQTGKLSFPPTVTESVRPYVKSRMVRSDADDDGYFDDESEDWDSSAEAENEVADGAYDDSDEGESDAGFSGRGMGQFDDDE
jgi:hypothetical protein